MNIEMNLISDWRDIMIERIKAEGLIFSSMTPKESVIIKYFTYQRKKGGVPRPRSIRKSQQFTCPPDLQPGLEKLLDVLRKGQDISPYFSTLIDKLTVVDGMFNDWGVLHLHLGEGIHPRDNRYIERTGPLLFLYLSANTDDAYLINIYDHHSWADRSVMQTVYDNWPELIGPFVMRGVTEVEPKYTDEDHKKLREAGVTVIMELKDRNGETVVVAPPGFGIVSSKDAFADVRTYHNWVRILYKLEDQIQSQPSNFEKIYAGEKPDTIRFKIISEDKKWFVCEETTKTKVFEIQGDL